MLISITKQDIEKILNATFDFVYDEETGEPQEEKLNNAWHEIFGMHKIMLQTQVDLTDRASMEEHALTHAMLSNAMATIEKLYDEQVSDSGSVSHFSCGFE